MKINENYIIKTMMDEVIIVPTGQMAKYFNGLITTNPVAGFIWQNLAECESPEKMVELVLENFEVDRDIANKDVLAFLEELKKAEMISY